VKLLDSSVLIGILRGDEKLRKVAKELSREEITTTVLTYFELFSRVYHRGLVDEEKILRKLLKLMNILDLDETSANKAAEIMGRLLRAGKPVNIVDVLISGIAITNGIEEIITKDTDFKTIEEIYGYPKIRICEA
jgi:hypothetical protein